MIEQEHIFHLEVDNTAKAYMLETARWAKFLAILSFIGMGILIAAGFYMSTMSSQLAAAYGNNPMMETMGPIMMVMYILIVAIYFYPVFALLKFSNLIKPAIQSANQQQFNNAFRYMKNMFKYIGIITIIILCLYGVVIIAAVVGLSMR